MNSKVVDKQGNQYLVESVGRKYGIVEDIEGNKKRIPINYLLEECQAIDEDVVDFRKFKEKGIRVSPSKANREKYAQNKPVKMYRGERIEVTKERMRKFKYKLGEDMLFAGEWYENKKEELKKDLEPSKREKKERELKQLKAQLATYKNFKKKGCNIDWVLKQYDRFWPKYKEAYRSNPEAYGEAQAYRQIWMDLKITGIILISPYDVD